MTLLDKQKLFSQLLARLIWELHDRGYSVTLGEAWRSPETAKVYAEEGKGIIHSLHCNRLACDLNLFLGDRYLTNTDDYRPAGVLWKSYSTADYTTCWGGDFSRPDADHFSLWDDGTE